MKRLRTDAGFTLIELLVAVVILGIITLPLGNFLLAYLTNYTQTTQRMSDSHDVQIATAYFSQDVANSQTISTGAIPAGSCGAGLGTPVLLLQWDSWSVTQTAQGPTGTSSGVSAAYVNEGGALHRVYCGSTTSDATLVHNFVSATPQCYTIAADGSRTVASCASSPALVELSLTISGGSTDSAAPTQPVTIDGQRRQS